MANFMPSGSIPGNDALGITAAGPGLTIEPFDTELAFDEAMLDSSVNGLANLPPFTPSYDFDTFSTTFEDPFSYSVAGAARFNTDVSAEEAEPLNGDASPQEPDNKLLGFSDPVLKASLVDEGGNFADIKFSAELLGMFFVAEDVFGATDTAPAGRPPELTCYRRNLFQCSGQITLPRSVSHAVDEEGKQISIVELVASLTALESIDNRPAEIISIPWKSSNPVVGNGGDDSKTAGAPANIPLDLSSGQELPDSVADSASGSSSGRVSVQIGWKRLQFKHATANNGRRKGLQQHYVVLITLLGKTTGGDLLPISEIRSGPVIVRGRSPRNFDSRKDVPLSGDNKKLERRATNESIGSSSQAKAGANEVPPALQRFNSLGTVAPPQTTDWSSGQPFGQVQQPSKRVALSPTLTRPPVPAWTSDSSIYSQSKIGMTTPSMASGNLQSAGAPSMPINLSLSEDERSPNRTGSETSPNLTKTLSKGQSNGEGDLLEDDLLYEYFPLSLDDWMPPVDAIYRPHVVHHVPPDFKAQQVRSKSKRYFAAD